MSRTHTSSGINDANNATCLLIFMMQYSTTLFYSNQFIGDDARSHFNLNFFINLPFNVLVLIQFIQMLYPNKWKFQTHNLYLFLPQNTRWRIVLYFITTYSIIVNFCVGNTYFFSHPWWQHKPWRWCETLLKQANHALHWFCTTITLQLLFIFMIHKLTTITHNKYLFYFFDKHLIRQDYLSCTHCISIFSFSWNLLMMGKSWCPHFLQSGHAIPTSSFFFPIYTMDWDFICSSHLVIQGEFTNVILLWIWCILALITGRESDYILSTKHTNKPAKQAQNLESCCKNTKRCNNLTLGNSHLPSTLSNQSGEKRGTLAWMGNMTS